MVITWTLETPPICWFHQGRMIHPPSLCHEQLHPKDLGLRSCLAGIETDDRGTDEDGVMRNSNRKQLCSMEGYTGTRSDLLVQQSKHDRSTPDDIRPSVKRRRLHMNDIADRDV